MTSTRGLFFRDGIPMAPGWKAWPGRLAVRGFTFLEVLIVVVVFGIIAGVALPLISPALIEARLNAATSEMVAAIEFAQMTALSTRRTCRVTIDATADTLLVEKVTHDASLLGAQTQLSEATVESFTMVRVDHPLLPFEDYEVDFTAADRFSGVNIVSSTFGAGNFVEFRPLGMPSTGGTVTVAVGDFQSVLTVNGLSGRVTLN